jgi:hypothetical protein
MLRAALGMVDLVMGPFAPCPAQGQVFGREFQPSRSSRFLPEAHRVQGGTQRRPRTNALERVAAVVGELDAQPCLRLGLKELAAGLEKLAEVGVSVIAKFEGVRIPKIAGRGAS